MMRVMVWVDMDAVFLEIDMFCLGKVRFFLTFDKSISYGFRRQGPAIFAGWFRSEGFIPMPEWRPQVGTIVNILIFERRSVRWRKE